VVHCLDSLDVGGTELNAVRTVERLDPARYDLTLVCQRGSGALRARFEAAGVRVLELPYPGLLSVGALRQGRALVKFLVSNRVEVVHSHDQYNNLFATACARLAGVPLVIASRRWWHTLPRLRHRITNALGFRLAHVVLGNSPAVASALVSEDGLKPDKVHCVPNFVDEDAFAPLAPETRRALLAELGVPDGAMVVGCVARLDPVKDLAMLLRAFARLARRHTAVHLVLVGDGPEREALRADAVRLGLSGHVHFAGTRPNRPNLHALFDVSVLTSRSEGFPNTIVEAMAAGRPIVATRVGGVPDAVEDDRSGLLVEARDDEAFALALESMLRDETRRAAFGDAARERARQLFHRSHVLPELEALYERARARRSSVREPAVGPADALGVRA
jgi:glycosyltransferase involved in cell wall biosynthesis